MKAIYHFRAQENAVRKLNKLSKLSWIAILMSVGFALGIALNPPLVTASSHREAPLISADPQADTTDLYAFVSPDKPDTVTIITNWIPFEEPAGGPNFNSFGDDVRYEVYVDNNGDAKADITYYFRFTTKVRNPNTFLYNVGPIASLTDPNWNMYQIYTVTRVDSKGSVDLGKDLLTPPANIGPKSTPNYDKLAEAAVQKLSDGSSVFAGQRDDPFFVDLGAVFDLLTIRKLPGNQGGGKDDLKGYNCHTIALQIPISLLTKDGSVPKDAKDGAAVIGVWSASSRKTTKVLQPKGATPKTEGDWVQVSRLGMPLVNEVVVPLAAKDLWNASKPEDDGQFLGGVTDPEPARLLKLLYNIQVPPTPRDDLVAIFLTGIPGLNQPPNVKASEQLRLNVAIAPAKIPNRFGVLGGDTAGFPNGRRLADDVTDVAVQAVAGVAYPLFHPEFKADPLAGKLGDGVDGNDNPFLASFPYVGSPHQGLEHSHDPAGQVNFHFVAVSTGPKEGNVQHLIAIAGDGKFSFNLSQVDGGGAFVHFDGASKVPNTILGSGTWKAKRLVGFNRLEASGPGVAAGILEMEIDLIRETPAPQAIIPAKLKVVANVGAPGLETGQTTGITLTIPEAKLEFKPLEPPLGVAIFTTGIEEGPGISGQTNFHFTAGSLGPKVDKVQHFILMAGNGKVTPSQVVGGGSFLHLDLGSPPPTNLLGLGAGTWKAKRLISFKSIGSYGVLTAGILEMEVDLLSAFPSSAVIPATLKVICNLSPAGILTGEDEGFTLNIPSAKLEFKPIPPPTGPRGLTAFSSGVAEADNVFFLQLDAGLNMISLPLQPAKPHTAKSFMQELGATIVIELDTKRGVFRGFTAASAGDGFAIDGGKGYIINVPSTKTVAFAGSAWRNQPPVTKAAPPIVASASNNSAWAFILTANVEELGEVTLTVRNPRTGSLETSSSFSSEPGNLNTIWADLNRRSVVQVGDKLEIQVKDGSQRLLGVLRHTVTPEEIRQAFAQLRITMKDLRPAKTVLLANYPNPFNPETWMPYQLSEDADVQIRIYDSVGRIVRNLKLGRQAAGYYIDRARAAYWDGRNDTGEKLASGVYFYQLVADKSVATRKMVILK